MSARDHALVAIDAIPLPHWKPRLIRKKLPPLKDTRDIALSERITIATIKHASRLQYLIAHYSGRNLASIDPIVQKILAVAIVQLHLLTRIPSHSAVDEAVEQTKRFGVRRASGFVNAVLRKAADNPQPPLPEPSDLRRYIEITLSHPWPLFERLSAVYKNQDRAVELCRRHNDEPPTIVRLSSTATIDDLKAEHLTLRPHEREGLVVVEGSTVADFARWSKERRAQPQDPTSVLAVAKLQPKRKQDILDRCCGVGTKTLQIADAVRDDARILAMDPNELRLAILRKTIDAGGTKNVTLANASMLDEIANAPPTFDRILIDAPCSNSGVLMRRPEARYTQSKSRQDKLVALQGKLLMECLPKLAPAGRLVYATCSIWPEENEKIVGEALGALGGFRRVEQISTLPTTTTDPTLHHDGGYLCVIERS